MMTDPSHDQVDLTGGTAESRFASASVKGGRSMAVLLVAVFAVMLGYGVTLTVLPYYAARVHRLGGLAPGSLAVHIGILTGLYSLAQLIVGPGIGRLADRYGRRPVALVGLVAVGATQIVFGFVTSLWLLYGLRIAGGIAASLLIVAGTAMVADWTDERSGPRGMALFGTAVSLGVVVGPLLGGMFNGVSIRALGVALDGYSAPFVVAGLLSLAAALLVMCSLDESAVPSFGPHLVASLRRSVLHRLAPALTLVVAAQFGLALFEGTFVLFARKSFGFSVPQITQAFMICGSVMAVLQLFAAGPLQRWMAPATQIALGFLAMASGVGALLIVKSAVSILTAVGVLAAGTALITPNLSALVAKANPGATATSLGLKSSAGSFGQFLGPVVGGSLLAWRAASPYALAAVILTGAGLTSRRSLRGRRVDGSI